MERYYTLMELRKLPTELLYDYIIALLSTEKEDIQEDIVRRYPPAAAAEYLQCYAYIHQAYTQLPYKQYWLLTQLYIQHEKWDTVERSSHLSRSTISAIRRSALDNIIYNICNV